MVGPGGGGPERRGGLSKKGAVAPMPAFHHCDVGIRVDLVAALSGETDERVVQRMQDQARHRNAVEYTGSGSTIVVIISTGEAGIKCRDAIVELPQRADSSSAVAIVSLREEHSLAAKTAQKIVKKLQLIESVLWQMQ